VAGTEVFSDLQQLISQEESKNLLQFMEDEGNVRADPTIFPIGIDLVTDHPRINRRNPRLVVLFAPDKEDSPSTISKTALTNQDPSNVDFGLDHSQKLRSTQMGMMFGLSIDKERGPPSWTPHQNGNRERVITNAIGFTNHSQDSQSLDIGSSKSTEVKVYGTPDSGSSPPTNGTSTNSSPSVVDEESDKIPEVTAEGGGVSTMDGCWVSNENCEDIIQVACAGARATLSQSSCVSAAISVGAVGGGPIGSALAYGFCQAIISWYGQVICQTQADEVCEGFINSECDGGDDNNCWIPFDPTCG
jgi:hypothetical protein